MIFTYFPIKLRTKLHHRPVKVFSMVVEKSAEWSFCRRRRIFGAWGSCHWLYMAPNSICLICSDLFQTSSYKSYNFASPVFNYELFVSNFGFNMFQLIISPWKVWTVWTVTPHHVGVHMVLGTTDIHGSQFRGPTIRLHDWFYYKIISQCFLKDAKDCFVLKVKETKYHG